MLTPEFFENLGLDPSNPWIHSKDGMAEKYLMEEKEIEILEKNLKK